MAHGDHMILSATSPDAFLHIAPFFPQVTTGCDHVLVPKALSAFANGKELIPAF
jgi:hypothetical protein